MPAQRQTNQQPYTAHLVEVRDADGTLYPGQAVDPGECVAWPQPIAGFSGWVPEPAPGAPEPADATEAAESAQAAKPRPKSSAKTTDTPEATS